MNYDLNRIKQLLKLYDEAKTTDAEEAELADFFRTATDVPEDLQDYAVLFSVLDSADTLFNNEKSLPLPLLKEGHSKVLPGFRRGWWAIGIAAAIIVVVGLFLWSNNTTDEVLPNRASVNPKTSPEGERGESNLLPLGERRERSLIEPVAEVKEIRVAEAKIERMQKPSQIKPEQIATVEDTTSTQPAEELLAEETSQQEQTTDSHSQSVRFGALPTGSTSKGFGGGYVGGSGGFGNGLIMTHVDSMLIGRVAGVDSLRIPEEEVPEYAMIHSSVDYCLAGDPTSDAWRDSVLVMVDGEVNEELHRAVRADGWFDIDLAEYFKEKGRLVNGESLWWENMKATKHSIREYVRKNGEKALTEEMRKALDSPYRYVANIETVAYPKQTANKKLQEKRRLAYLQQKYLAGFIESPYNSYPLVKVFSPDLFDSDAEELLFGQRMGSVPLGDAKEGVGCVREDAQGIYVSIIRTLLLRGGRHHTLPYFCTDSMTADIRQMASKADCAVEYSDSDLTYIGFIYGGKVIKGEEHYIDKFDSRISYFDFTVPDRESATMWAEAQIRRRNYEYPPGMVAFREGAIELYVQTIDKLYAKDCPEILTNRRWVEGTITDTSGKPLSGVQVCAHMTNDGMTTGADGKFGIWLPYKNATFDINITGYKSRAYVKPTDEPMVIAIKKWGEN